MQTAANVPLLSYGKPASRRKHNWDQSKASGSGLPARPASAGKNSPITTGKRLPQEGSVGRENSGAIWSGEGRGRKAGRRMVARPAPVRARKVRRHPPLEVARGLKGMGIDETEPRANRRSLVQVDAHSADVALTRPVRVPDVRAAPSRVLGTTSAGGAVRDGNVLRNARAKCFW
jgi:hypothetical protein